MENTLEHCLKKAEGEIEKIFTKNKCECTEFKVVFRSIILDIDKIRKGLSEITTIKYIAYICAGFLSVLVTIFISLLGTK